MKSVFKLKLIRFYPLTCENISTTMPSSNEILNVTDYTKYLESASKRLFSNFMKYDFLHLVLSNVLGSMAVSIYAISYIHEKCQFATSNRLACILHSAIVNALDQVKSSALELKTHLHCVTNSSIISIQFQFGRFPKMPLQHGNLAKTM